MKRDVYIIGDSLAYDRPDGLNTEERWPNILKRRLDFHFNIINYSRGSTTTNRLVSLYKTKIPREDILIIQIGIVDCAPRYFNHYENFLLARFPLFLRKKIISFIKKKRIQSHERAYVRIDKFKENLKWVVERHKGVIIYVKILPPGNKLEKANPEIRRWIESYNHVIDGFPKIATLSFGVDKETIDAYTLEDGYHLNIEGHKFIANQVEVLLNRLHYNPIKTI